MPQNLIHKYTYHPNYQKKRKESKLRKFGERERRILKDKLKLHHLLLVIHFARGPVCQKRGRGEEERGRREGERGVLLPRSSSFDETTKTSGKRQKDFSNPKNDVIAPDVKSLFFSPPARLIRFSLFFLLPSSFFFLLLPSSSFFFLLLLFFSSSSLSFKPLFFI